MKRNPGVRKGNVGKRRSIKNAGSGKERFGTMKKKAVVGKRRRHVKRNPGLRKGHVTKMISIKDTGSGKERSGAMMKQAVVGKQRAKKNANCGNEKRKRGKIAKGS